MVLDLLRRRRHRRRPQVALETQPDDVPKRGLFTEPVRVAALRARDPELLDDGRRRVSFEVELRDSEDARCPDVSVEARVAGPERSRTAQGTTDLFGRIRFRTAGPPGTYEIEILDVAAGGLDWDRDAGPAHLDIEVA